MVYLVNFGKRDEPHLPSSKHRLPPEMLRQDLDAAPTADVCLPVKTSLLVMHVQRAACQVIHIGPMM